VIVGDIRQLDCSPLTAITGSQFPSAQIANLTVDYQVMARPRVLISGAGIAGAVLGYWLGQYGFEVVILERSKSSTQQGQVIDIEGPARDVVSKMGLLETIKSQSTREAGIKFVDAQGNAFGLVPAAESKLSNEIEIMRPTLQAVLLKALNLPNVEVRRGLTIDSIEQSDASVTVSLSNDSKHTFDILVVADGLRSRTRRMLVSPEVDDASLKSLPYFSAFFSMPANEADQTEAFCRVHTAAGRRSLTTKPLPNGNISCYVNYMKYDEELYQARLSRDSMQQKDVIRRKFEGVGWEAPRILSGMMKADNFYFEQLGQVFMDKWSYGRCVLLGDSAYCPSPLTGEGTNLAILGAYLLAWNLIKQESIEKAFAGYEADLRPYVKKTQPIGLGGWLPTLVHPQSGIGVYCLQMILWIVSWIQPWKYVSAIQPTPFDLPEMPGRDQASKAPGQ
jgi:2-polyprenyl-6-methoxyphenol hydroxylase-like FAD-dependent oxidoreductase